MISGLKTPTKRQQESVESYRYLQNNLQL